jgi:hypothetical protein
MQQQQQQQQPPGGGGVVGVSGLVRREAAKAASTSQALDTAFQVRWAGCCVCVCGGGVLVGSVRFGCCSYARQSFIDPQLRAYTHASFTLHFPICPLAHTPCNHNAVLVVC